MSFIMFNPNPTQKQTGDCVIRAISIAEGMTWDEAFKAITDEAFQEKDIPSMNPVWTNYLIKHGYTLHGIPNTCPRCYTVADFAYDHPYGTYILGTGSHAIAVIDGNYIDTWDSGSIQPMYYLKKGEQNHGSYATEPVQTADTWNPGSNVVNEPIPATADSVTNSGSVLGAGIGGSQGLPGQHV